MFGPVESSDGLIHKVQVVAYTDTNTSAKREVNTAVLNQLMQNLVMTLDSVKLLSVF